MKHSLKGWITTLLTLPLSVSFLSAPVFAGPKLIVIPEQAEMTTKLIKEPVCFKGSGWKEKEMVSIELVVPKGMEMKGLDAGEERVGIGFATVDEKGNFETKMDALATLNWFFQVGWVRDPETTAMKPDFKDSKALPPGKYEILATGIYSEEVCRASFEVMPPSKKDK